MADDNTTLSFGIDTAKFRADAAIVKNELRGINKEVAAAAKAGDASRLASAAAEQDKLSRQYASLTRQIRGATAATKENTAANERATHSFREMGVEIGHLAHYAGVSVEGIRALRFGFAALATAVFVRNIKEAITSLNELNSTARAIRANPQQLKAMGESFEKTGQDAKLAATFIGTFNKQWDEAALKQSAASRGGASGVAVFAGGQKPPVSITDFSIAMRGGQPDRSAQLNAIMADPTRALLGRDINIKDRAGDMKEVAKQILAVKDATLQNALAQKIYGLTFEQAEQQIKQTAGVTPLHIDPAPTEQHNEALKTYNENLTELDDWWHKLNGNLGLVIVGTAAAATHMRTWQDALNEVLAPLYALTGIKPPPAASANLPPPLPTGNAAGGLIRGAGSGSSDSILARLSNGEFVVRAESVRRVGVGFLRGLNSFAGGGFVGAPLPRFAAGGLVSAGRPVHLHLGGHSFALSGAGSVVDSLVAEAHSQQIRSAGTKPSWYAGRPGGR